MNFWNNLPRPFFALAPMENVTDTVFRQVVIKAGKPDVFFTEFTNTDGLLSKGKKRVALRLQFTKSEKPLIAQIWGNNPSNYFKTAQELSNLGFDGIDINMGCPDRSIVSKGCCSGLINNPSLAKELYLAAKEGGGDLPISIKTRIGYKVIQTEKWIGFLLALFPSAITIHARTAKEMSNVPAHWDEIGKAVKLRNQLKSNTLIIGNGDVSARIEGIEKAKQFGVDGIMIGRGIFHDPWIFASKRKDHTFSSRLDLLAKHALLFEKTWKDTKDFNIMKKFVKMYISGTPYAAKIRAEFMNCKSAVEIVEFCDKFKKQYKALQTLQKSA